MLGHGKSDRSLSNRTGPRAPYFTAFMRCCLTFLLSARLALPPSSAAFLPLPFLTPPFTTTPSFAPPPPPFAPPPLAPPPFLGRLLQKLLLPRGAPPSASLPGRTALPPSAPTLPDFPGGRLPFPVGLGSAGPAAFSSARCRFPGLPLPAPKYHMILVARRSVLD